MRSSNARKLLTAVALTALAWTAPGLRAQGAIHFDIPAQSLADSLREVGSRANVNVLFDPPLVAGFQAPALSGQLTTVEALSLLLAGTQIHYEFLNDRTVVLSPAPATDKDNRGLKTLKWPRDTSSEPDKLASPEAALRSRASSPEAAAGPEAPVSLEEIVVTAQKRSERLLDVPMSISVVTGEALARQGAMSLLDIASTVPGMSTAQFSPGQNRVQLRGISSLQGLPTVGQYLDEIPLNVEGGFPTYGADIRFIDLQRIEVLRGPQGTLYGEGSMGGTIRYLTHDPDLKSPAFTLDGALAIVTDGSQLYRTNIVANLPLVSDVLGIRLAGGYERSPGWIDYPALGRSDVNDGTSKTARLKTLWRPSDDFTAELLLLYQDTDQSADSLGNQSRVAPFLIATPYIDRNRLGSLVLNYDAGAFTVLSATGLMSRTSNQTLDYTTLLGNFYQMLGVSPNSTQYPHTISARALFEFKSISEEIRFASDSAGPLVWTAGLYYRDYWENGTVRSVATPDPLPFALLDDGSADESRSVAVFGQLSYHFAPKVEATVGLRYFRDDRSIPGGPEGSELGQPVVTLAQDATFTSINPRLVASYRPDGGTLLYLSAAEGFRSGGMNGSSVALAGCPFPVNFDPEKLWTYELGANLSRLDGRVTIQAALYYNDWKQIQELQYCPGLAALGPQTISGGRAKGTGFDLQVSLRPLSSLSLALTGSYNNSYYRDDSAAHIAGDRVDFVPRWTAAVSGDYDFKWCVGIGGRAHLDYQYTGAWSVALRNQLATPTGAAFSDAYALLNARVSAVFGKWEVAVFGQNIADVNKRAIPQYGGYLAQTTLQPRTLGIGLRYNY